MIHLEYYISPSSVDYIFKISFLSGRYVTYSGFQMNVYLETAGEQNESNYLQKNNKFDLLSLLTKKLFSVYR